LPIQRNGDWIVPNYFNCLSSINSGSLRVRRILGLGWVPVLFFAAASFAQAQTWHAIPLVTAAARATGIEGGEGGQAIRTLVMSQTDPKLLLMGTDVGGIYRTTDGGLHWQVCMNGWNARGGNAFAIDPKNPDHILGVGANGNDFGPASMGVYLSTDRGTSWKQTLPRNDGNEWRRDSIAFDPSSFDVRLGYCTVAYFESRNGGLFKSTDGGGSWTLACKERSGAAMKIHPTKGYLYLADNSQHDHGFYKSSDGGNSFRRINENYTLGIDVISTHPDDVYIARWDKVLVSNDCGETFHPVGHNKGLPDNTPIQDIRVSAAHPKIMACKHGGPQWWESYAYYSDDAGDSWHKPAYDNTLAFLPFTQPDEKCVFDPTDPKIVFSTVAGGWVVKSTDGGKHYAWSSNGENAIMLGSSFNFSLKSPDTVFLAFQDYDGASTGDGGKTWIYQNPAGNGWGGFDYGGYTVDGKLMWCGDAPGWTGKRTLKLSRDGGKQWAVVKGSDGKPIVVAGPDISFSDPQDGNNCFASNYWSTDAGQSWRPMTGCDGVFISDPTGKILFGKHGNSICRSNDHGRSWNDMTNPVDGGIRDLAVHGDVCYAASNEQLKKFVEGKWETIATPKDQYGQVHIWTVAIDPQNSSAIYAGGPANLYATAATIIRSTDAGKNWINLTQPTGPHEVQWVRVHPKTRQAWVNGECYGMWKIDPPAQP